MQNKTLRLIERRLLLLGGLLLAAYLGAMLYRFSASRFALWQFQKAQAAELQNSSLSVGKSQGGEAIDFRLWAEKRIQGYRESLSLKKDLPVAVLRIGKLGIEVPVFDGTDDLTLNRGVGRIIGTARPGGPGNIGIAGHRDGFFRGLKDISVGDDVELTTTKRGPHTLWIRLKSSAQLMFGCCNRGVCLLSHLLLAIPFTLWATRPIDSSFTHHWHQTD